MTWGKGLAGVRSSNLSLRHFQVLCAVVQHGSLSEAARALHVSTSGVSLAITQLEEHLGMQLLVRARGKGITVTPTGQRIYEQAQDIAAILGDMEATASSFRGDLAGPLRVGIFTTLSPWLLPGIAEHFSVQHPRVDVRFEEGSSGELQAGLLSGRLDAALLYENHVAGDVAARRITPVRLQVALAPDHPLTRLDAVPLAALREEPAVLLAIRPASDHVEQILRDAGMTPLVRWRSPNIETVRALVGRGLGYAIVMGRPYGDTTYEGLPIVYRRIADDLPANSVVLATGKGARRTARLDALESYCLGEFGVPAGGLHLMSTGRASHDVSEVA